MINVVGAIKARLRKIETGICLLYGPALAQKIDDLSSCEALLKGVAPGGFSPCPGNAIVAPKRAAHWYQDPMKIWVGGPGKEQFLPRFFGDYPADADDGVDDADESVPGYAVTTT